MDLNEEEKDFALKLIQALHNNLTNPTPTHQAAAETMLAELEQRMKQSPPVDMKAYETVSEILEVLETGKVVGPDQLIQSVIEAGNRYLDNPTDENKSNFDAILQQSGIDEQGLNSFLSTGRAE